MIFFHSGIVKHQINLDTHPPGCEMPRNGTNRPNASHVVWCLEDPQFQADKPEVQFEKKIVLPLLKQECVSFLLLIRDVSLKAFIDKFLLQKFRPCLKERLPS